MSESTRLAYLAGFFDGEGCIRLQRKHNSPSSYTAAVNISQTKDRGKAVLEKLSALLAEYGITSRVFGYSRISHPHYSTLYCLQITSRSAVKHLIELILPYLQVKKVEAEDVLRFIKLYKCSKQARFMLMSESYAKRKKLTC